jgi:hypothetical protein
MLHRPFTPFLTVDKPLPVVPGEIILEEASPGTPVVVPFPEHILVDGRSNVPLGMYPYDDTEDDFYYDEESMHSRWKPDVSTVAEVTEPSESGHSTGMGQPSFEVRHSLGRQSSQTSTTDYGKIIGKLIFAALCVY